MGGSKATNSGALTVLIPADLVPAKGDVIEVFSLIGEEAAIGFTATKIKVKGTSVSATSYAGAAETVTTGKITVKSYDPETKVLKFNLKAKASPFTQTKGTEIGTSTKNFVIKAQGVITLP